MRTKANSASERETLQRRLALLERDTSGKNAKEIAELREQLREMQEDNYYDSREEAISDLEASLQAEQNMYQREIDILNEVNQEKLNNMQLYWDEVGQIMDEGSLATLEFLKSYSTTYLEASATQQQDYIDQWQKPLTSR